MGALTPLFPIFLVLLWFFTQVSCHQYGRIALYSVANPSFLAKHESAIASKQCYCLLRGYTFVLDTYEPSYHGRSPHWTRIPGLSRLLPHFDWVLYLDADILVTNSSVQIESFLDRVLSIFSFSDSEGNAAKRTAPFLVVQDGYEINSGAFLMRRSPETVQFLDTWWNFAPKLSHLLINDQSALQAALLQYAAAATGFPQQFGFNPVDVCTRLSGYNQWQACWWVWMNRMGLPFGNRSVGGIVYFTPASPSFTFGGTLNQSTSTTLSLIHAVRSRFPPPTTSESVRQGGDDTAASPRGFNMLSGTGSPSPAFINHPSQIWALGDFILHTTTGYSPVIAQDAARVLSPLKHMCNEDWVYVPPSRVAVAPSHAPSGDHGGGCEEPPCLWQLWGTAHTYLYDNLWRDYIPERMLQPEVPDSCASHDPGPIDPNCTAFDGPHEYGNDLFSKWPLLPLTSGSDGPSLCPGYLTLRVVVNISGSLPHHTDTYAFSASDVVISPGEDVASRLIDSGYVIGGGAFGSSPLPLLHGVASEPQMLCCRTLDPARAMAAWNLPPRVYSNHSDFIAFQSVVDGEAVANVHVMLLPLAFGDASGSYPWRQVLRVIPGIIPPDEMQE